MKKGLLSLFIALCCFANTAKAQIALAYDDTLICRGDEITMSASFSGMVGNITQDDVYDNQVVNLGFPFQFYGQTYTQCLISANGYIIFNTAGKTGAFSPYTWTGALTGGHADAMIAPGLTDLWPVAAYGGKIRYQSFGTPGNRRFVVEWCDIGKYGSSCVHLLRVTMQVILYEGSNIIEFHVKDMPSAPGCPSASPGIAVQGIRYVNGTTINEFFTPGRGPGGNFGNVSTYNSSTRFTPTAATPFYTIDTGIAFNPWLIIENINSSLLKWYDANGNFLHQGPNLTVSPVNPPSPATQTFYVVEYTGQAGCNDTTTLNFKDTVIVNYSDIKTYITESMCAGSTYNFYGNILYSPGVYDTTFSSVIGCDSMVILTLNVNPLPEAQIISNPKAKICAGDRFVFRAQSAPGYQYQWMRNGIAIAGANADTFGTDVAGKYAVKVTAASSGCNRTSDEIELVIAPNPTAKINYVSETEICAMDTVTLTVAATGDNLEYIWTPNQYYLRTATPQRSSTVEAIVPQSGYLTVTVRNNDLCTATDSVYIKAEPCCDLRMPNAFTPNGDGKNDYFLPQLEVGQKIIHFQIYDRQGQLVYESGAGNVRGWDGKNQKGKDVGEGVYMYIMKYACSDNSNYEKKGDVSLLR
jgi:gliding motility-associated-like protein